MKRWIVAAILVLAICTPGLADASVEDLLNQDNIKEELERGTKEQISALDIDEWDVF